jgi:hypothetical protein
MVRRPPPFFPVGALVAIIGNDQIFSRQSSLDLTRSP